MRWYAELYYGLHTLALNHNGTYLILSHSSNSPCHQTLHGFLLDLEDLDLPVLLLPPAAHDTHTVSELTKNSIYIERIEIFSLILCN